ncbi:MAG TPA: hypothetical protein VGQ34_06850 [Sphingomicrobium sp.]|jgi:uncharacterized protein YlxW (UPF0749 family)|nr:hypothetical protein [Sphingomicrobium sp.]
MHFWTFVFAICALSIIGKIVNNWIKARNGYPIDEESDLPAPKTHEMVAIRAENQKLKATVSRLEDRLKVLERIATDPSRRLADEINELQ